MDLSKLSDADLKALASGDMSKVSDEGLKSLSAPNAPAPKLGDSIANMVPAPIKSAVNAVQAFHNGMLRGASAGMADPNKLPGTFGQGAQEASQEHPAASAAGDVAGNIAGSSMLFGPETQLGQLLGKTPVRRTAMGGVQGAYSDPEHPVRGAALGLLTGMGAEGLAKLLGTGGDVAMQVAVGRKKYTPGVGNTIANEGVMGTRNMMQNQVENKLAQRGQQLSDMAKEVPGTPIDAPKIAQDVQSTVQRPYMVPGGQPSAEDLPKLEKITDFTSDIASRGPETASQGLARRIAAGQRSYRGKEDPMQSLVGNLSKNEQIGYSQALKSAHQAATDSDAFADADHAYGALKRAQSGLNEEISLPKSIMGLLSTGAHVVPGGSLGLSTLGQLGTKSADVLQSPVTRGLVLEGLRNANSNNQ